MNQTTLMLFTDISMETNRFGSQVTLLSQCSDDQILIVLSDWLAVSDYPKESCLGTIKLGQYAYVF